MPDRKLWDQILDKLGRDLIPDELRRWFGESMQAADSGDQAVVPADCVRPAYDSPMARAATMDVMPSRSRCPSGCRGRSM